MKIRYYQALALNEILMGFSNTKLPSKVSYSVMKLLKSLGEDLEFYYQKINEIVKDCSESDEDGNPKRDESGQIIIKKDKTEECTVRFSELDSIEIDLPDYKIPISLLDGVEISPQDLIKIEPIIEGED